jgi:hypothetical protein
MKRARCNPKSHDDTRLGYGFRSRKINQYREIAAYEKTDGRR